jgi:predicted NBD/HSP70 family sugar kinase
MTVRRERISIGLSAPAKVKAATGADSTRSHLFAEILTVGPLSRTQLASRTGLSQSTITKLVNPLVESGFVLESGAITAGFGRPQRLLEVAAERHTVIGVKIGPERVTGVLTDLRARVLIERSRELSAGHDPAAVLAACAAAASDLISSEVSGRERLLGVGVGIGGHVDAATGTVVHSGVLGWDMVQVAAPIAAATGLPTVVGNDVDALAVAERWFGAGRDLDTFALVTVGPGIGCGLFLGGALYTGAGGLAGELGHIPVCADGLACSCGNRGCLETVASDRAVLRRIAELTGSQPAGIDDAVGLARAGDEAACGAFEEMGEALGRGLATVCNLVNPGRIVLTGERASAHDLFGPACERSWRAHSFSTAGRDCELVIDATDDAQWARGAGCLVIREAVGGPSA